MTAFNPEASDVHRQDGAESDQEDDERHEHGFYFDQVQDTHLVEIRFRIESFGSSVLAMEAFQHPHPSDVLLNETRQSALSALFGVAFPVNVCRDEVDAG